MKFTKISLISCLMLCYPISQLHAQYLGGNDDGYATIKSPDLFMDGSSPSNIYSGSIGDGYALVASGFFSLIPGLVFSVDRTTGDVFALGSLIPSGADIAEHINVSEPVEPGDVVELDPNKPQFYRKTRGSSHLIAGVITTEPGFTLGNNLGEIEADVVLPAVKDSKIEFNNRALLALMGRVPVKATTEWRHSPGRLTYCI